MLTRGCQKVSYVQRNVEEDEHQDEPANDDKLAVDEKTLKANS